MKGHTVEPDQIRPVSIGNNVWIGEGVTILKGVTIEDGAVVGAKSVVTRNIAKNGVVVGNPAREKQKPALATKI